MEANALFKTCTKCGELKSLNDFHKDKWGKQGRHSYCAACKCQTTRERHQKNPEIRKAINRKNRYGVEECDYKKLLVKQDLVCAICSGLCIKSLCVDHDHESGMVRGLLCNNCNVGIGYLKDSPNVLASAIIYLHQHGKSLTCEAVAPP